MPPPAAVPVRAASTPAVAREPEQPKQMPQVRGGVGDSSSTLRAHPILRLDPNLGDQVSEFARQEVRSRHRKVTEAAMKVARDSVASRSTRRPKSAPPAGSQGSDSTAVQPKATASQPADDSALQETEFSRDVADWIRTGDPEVFSGSPSEDDDDIEIISGLAAGETVAVQNTFTLKAEVEKDEAEHDHD